MHTGETIPQMCRLIGNTDWCSSFVWTLVVPAWLRANGHTIRYITSHNTANIQHHTVTQVQHWLGKGDDASKHLLAELGHLSLNTLTQRKNWRSKLAQQEMSVMFAAGWENLTSTVTVWMNIWGVTQPGTGTWSPEDQSLSRLGHLTNCMIERNNIKFNL